jgi:hypothetical protein
MISLPYSQPSIQRALEVPVEMHRKHAYMYIICAILLLLKIYENGDNAKFWGFGIYIYIYDKFNVGLGFLWLFKESFKNTQKQQQ